MLRILRVGSSLSGEAHYATVSLGKKRTSYSPSSSILLPARCAQNQVWDGEYLSLYRVFVAILVFLIGPVFIILRGTVLVIGHYASPLGFFSCGNWR